MSSQVTLELKQRPAWKHAVVSILDKPRREFYRVSQRRVRVRCRRHDGKIVTEMLRFCAVLLTDDYEGVAHLVWARMCRVGLAETTVRESGGYNRGPAVFDDYDLRGCSVRQESRWVIDDDGTRRLRRRWLVTTPEGEQEWGEEP